MMVRALLLSMLLHLAILASGRPESSARLSGEEGGRRGLAVSVRKQAASPGSTSVAATTEQRGEMRVGEGRSSPDAQSSRGAKHAEIGPYLPSTVAFANHDPNADVKAHGEDLSDVIVSGGGGEREYRLNLAREARRYKRYPSGGNGRESEGVVVLSVSVLNAALRPETHVQQSSGDDLLDQAAQEMMEQAVKTASIPLELRGRRFQVAVPVEYRLSD